MCMCAACMSCVPLLLQYVVNDLHDTEASMALLLERFGQMGIVVVVVEHFAPSFLPGVGGYKGLMRTSEPTHEQLAQQHNLTSVSMRNATGLPTVWAAASGTALQPCAFACGFSSDQIHPNPCGQRWMAQLTTTALQSLLESALLGVKREETPNGKRTAAGRLWQLLGLGSPSPPISVPD